MSGEKPLEPSRFVNSFDGGLTQRRPWLCISITPLMIMPLGMVTFAEPISEFLLITLGLLTLNVAVIGGSPAGSRLGPPPLRDRC
jgi:hypothetical protein